MKCQMSIWNVVVRITSTFTTIYVTISNCSSCTHYYVLNLLPLSCFARSIQQVKQIKSAFQWQASNVLFGGERNFLFLWTITVSAQCSWKLRHLFIIFISAIYIGKCLKRSLFAHSRCCLEHLECHHKEGLRRSPTWAEPWRQKCVKHCNGIRDVRNDSENELRDFWKEMQAFSKRNGELTANNSRLNASVERRAQCQKSNNIRIKGAPNSENSVDALKKLSTSWTNPFLILISTALLLSGIALWPGSFKAQKGILQGKI